MGVDSDIEQEPQQQNQSEFSLFKNNFVSNIFLDQANNLQEKTERLTQSNSLNTTIDLLKDTQFKQKHLDVWLSEAEFEKYVQKINDVLRIYLDWSLDDFPVSIIDSIVVWWQSLLMDTLSKMTGDEAENFFWSIDGSNISWNFLTTAWSLFKTFGKSWEFLKLAKKFQNFTEFLNMHSGQFDENSTLLNNPYYTFKLMDLHYREDKTNLDTLKLENIEIDGKNLLDKETDSSNLEMTEEQKQELQAIANNTSSKINKNLIDKINNWALDAATMFFFNRETYKQVASQPLWLLSSLFDKEILWFNAGTQISSMFGISASTFDEFIQKTSTWKNKWIINVVLHFLWVSNWIKWLAKEYYKGKIDKIIPDKTQLSKIFSSFQKEKDDEITNDDTDSTRKTLKLDTNLSSKTDEEKNILKNTLIPPQLADLSTSLLDNLDNMKIDPKVASEAGLTSYLTNKDDKYILRENISDADKEEFVKKYLLYIIPTIATNFDTTDASLSQDHFTLMILWTLFYGTEFKWAVAMNALSPSLFSTEISRNIDTSILKTDTYRDFVVDEVIKPESGWDFWVVNKNDVNKWPSLWIIQRNWESWRAYEYLWVLRSLDEDYFDETMWENFITKFMWEEFNSDLKEKWTESWEEGSVNYKYVRRFKTLMENEELQKASKDIAINNMKEKYLPITKQLGVTNPDAIVYCMRILNAWTSVDYLSKFVIGNATDLDSIHNQLLKVADIEIEKNGENTERWKIWKNRKITYTNLKNNINAKDFSELIDDLETNETNKFEFNTTNMAILWDSVWVKLNNSNTRKEASVKWSASFWNTNNELNLTKKFESMKLENVNSCLIFAGLNQKFNTDWIDQNAVWIKNTAESLQNRNIIPVLVKPYMPKWDKYKWDYETNMKSLRKKIDETYSDLSKNEPKPVLIDLSNYIVTNDVTQKDDPDKIYCSDWLHPTDMAKFTELLKINIKQ